MHTTHLSSLKQPALRFYLALTACLAVGLPLTAQEADPLAGQGAPGETAPQDEGSGGSLQADIAASEPELPEGLPEDASGAELLMGGIVAELLQEGGLLPRQEEITQSLLLMDRQARHAEHVNRLISLLGPDAHIETKPGVFERFGDLPMGRQARITEINLKRDKIEARDALDDARERHQEMRSDLRSTIESDVESEVEDILVADARELFGAALDQADAIQGDAQETVDQIEQNADEFREFSISRAEERADEILDEARETANSIEADLERDIAEHENLVDGLEAEIARLEQERDDPDVTEDPDAEFIAFSIDSIEGSSGDYRAVIRWRGVLVRVTAGDELPDGTRIVAVDSTGLEYEFQGERDDIRY